MDVITNIPVLSVKGIIEDSNVIFVPKVIFAHSNDIPKCPQLPVSPLPTPIRYDRFAPLRLIIYHHASSIQMLLTKN
jgi:hypothetical protein